MIKQLILVFHLIGVFFYQLIFSGNITATQNMPANINSGGEVTVEIRINKSDVSGFAKVQQQIPEGFSVEVIESKGATFSFKDGKFKLIWMSLPADAEFTVSYKLKSNDIQSGDFEIGGKFSFISNNERQNIEIPISTITVVPAEVEEPLAEVVEEAVGEEIEEEVIEPEIGTPVEEVAEEVAEEVVEEVIDPVVETPVEETVDIEPEVKEEVVAEVQTVSVQTERTVEEIETGKFKVVVKINKTGIEGFAKLEEVIPSGFIASQEESASGVFSFKNQKAKILWMSIPAGEDIEVAYLLTADEDNKGGDFEVTGSFSYLDNDITQKYIANSSEFAYAVPEEENIVAEEPIEEVVVAEETVAEVVEEPVEEVNEIELVEEESNSQEITSIPAPETGVSYKVQVGAGHQKVASTYFFTKFNLKDDVSIEMHDGWRKYLVGSFGEYKAARDKRNLVRANVKRAFVSAYNQGNRITVQEALMISNQKWYK